MLATSVQRPRRYIEWRELEAWKKWCPPKRQFQNTVLEKKARREVRNVLRLVSDVNFDAGALLWHLKRRNYYRQASNDSRDEEIAEKDFKKQIGRGGSGS